jgi:hypothetical protein
VLVRAPWVREELNGHAAGKANPDLKTPAIVPAHPASVALALLLLRVKKVGAVASAWATVLEPATEHGRAAMDELHAADDQLCCRSRAFRRRTTTRRSRSIWFLCSAKRRR